MQNLRDKIEEIISVQMDFATEEIERAIENYGEIESHGSLEDILNITKAKLVKIYIDHINEEAKLHFRAKELTHELAQKYRRLISPNEQTFWVYGECQESLDEFNFKYSHLFDYEERQKVQNLLDEFETL
tara:strand:+ start:827 stop:1216 length:390 start_codon:yes stop_codon:yes gene_type:complete